MRIPARWVVLSCLLCERMNAQAVPFSMKDQYGKEVTIGAPSAEWTLLIYGDRAGSKFMDNWGDGLRGLPHCRIVFAADLHAVPFFMKGTVTGMFHGNGPSGKPKGPVLLDWGETIGRAFGFAPSVANVYALDPSGRMRARDSGKGGASDLDRFTAALTRLLTQKE